jgi:hypothetical protein
MSHTKQVSNKKPFCKVCQDAGKPESEYTSHYVRSMPDKSGKSKVTCPTLLATECRFCYKLGHTTKFCPVIEANKKSEERAANRKQTEEKKPLPKAKAPSSVFAALADDSDSDEEKVVKVSNKVSNNVKEEFPSLGSKNVQEAKPAMSGWASVAAKTAVQYENEKYEQQLISNSIKRSLPPLSKTVVIPQPQMEKKSWADWSDSEDEQEQFEVAYEKVAPAPMRFTAADLDWAAVDSDSDEDW